MAKLKLGPLPKLGTVRITVAIAEPLKEELDLYAAEYSRLYGQVDMVVLIPHMLEAFLRSDRGWRGQRAAVAARSESTRKATKAADDPHMRSVTDQ